MLFDDPHLDPGGVAGAGRPRLRQPHGPAARALTTIMVVAALLVPTSVATAANDEPVAAGAFEPAGSLAVSRNGHTATALPDGRVLIAGGGKEDAPRTAEAWVEGTATFEPAGALRKRRKSHTATLLTDGRVLLVGGSRARPTTEIFDPASGVSTASGPLAIGRNGHTATLLHDGRVLVVGGWQRPGWLTSAEIWDPATGSFERTGSLARARMSHTATLLPDGRVLVIGGHGADQYKADAAGNLRYPDEPRALAEIWDPATGEFEPAGSLDSARSQHAAALLPDGRVLVVGGWDVEGDPTLAEVWNPDTMTFSPAGWSTVGAETATTLPDGRVLVVGATSAELWDPAWNSFIPAGTTDQTRRGHTATLLDDGRVLIVSGWGRDSSSTAELWQARPLPDDQVRALAEQSLVCGELREDFRPTGTTGDPERDAAYLTRCLTCEELWTAIQFARINEWYMGLELYQEHCDPSLVLPPAPETPPAPD